MTRRPWDPEIAKTAGLGALEQGALDHSMARTTIYDVMFIEPGTGRADDEVITDRLLVEEYERRIDWLATQPYDDGKAGREAQRSDVRTQLVRRRVR